MVTCTSKGSARRSCNVGDAIGCSSLVELRCANYQSIERNQKFCRDIPKTHCDLGELDFCAALGRFYEQPIARQFDGFLAKKLFDDACNKGSAVACYDAAQSLAYTDKPRALELYVRACDLKHGAGCLEAGTIERAANHDARVLAWFERGCAQSNVHSCTLLGVMLLGGEGGKKDELRAKRVLDEACKKGDDGACAFK